MIKNKNMIPHLVLSALYSSKICYQLQVVAKVFNVTILIVMIYNAILKS